MSLSKDLVGLGVVPNQAEVLGFPGTTAVTTAGTTTGAATVLTAAQRVALLTTASSQTGVRLPAAAPLMVPYIGTTLTATTGVLYPPTGGKFNGGTTDAGVNVAQNKAFIAMRYSATEWIVIVGG